MKNLHFIILVIFIACCANTPRYYITYDSDRIEIQHPQIGDFMITKYALKVMGDSIFVPPGVLVFGNDPNIRIVRFDPKKHMHIWGPRTSVDFINLEPDTLAFSFYRDEMILEDRFFIGLIERGIYSIRYSLNESFPAGKYLFQLSVGEETEKIKKTYLK